MSGDTASIKARWVNACDALTRNAFVQYLGLDRRRQSPLADDARWLSPGDSNDH